MSPGQFAPDGAAATRDGLFPMRLRHSPTSPYVRKVMVTAHETGLIDRITVVPTNTWDPATTIGEDNPLGKVPVVRFADGRMVPDSRCLCDILDRLHDGDRLFPEDPDARIAALRWLALGDGITDAAVTRLLEARHRSPDEGQAWWLARQTRALAATLDCLEQEAGMLTDAPVSIGHIAIGCALGYLDFRFTDDYWRDNRPGLAAWFDSFAQRPSMRATEPPRG